MSESTQEFASSFRTFMDRMSAAAPREEPEIRRRLREHFGDDPARLPILGHAFASHDKANLQIAIDSWCKERARAHDMLGVASPYRGYQKLSLASLVTSAGHEQATVGPVEYETVSLADGREITCVHSGLLLLETEDGKFAVLVQGPTQRYDAKITVEIMAPRREDSERLLHELRETIRKRNVYRGRIISLDVSIEDRALKVEFHRLPEVKREGIILPAGTLERIERHTVGFAKHGDRLKGAGRHLKRGLLLYGPPGTGKTYTAMYLASKMPGRTVLLVTGRGQGLIEETCAMARALEPATVVLEDVDLIGTERGYASRCASPLLFELLNQMDGLAEDSDILFLLTTNRPDILEPALAARPGRVDQAIEVPLPDAECRRRLFDLYAHGLRLRVSDMDAVVRRTEGASAAFMKELLRRAALFAADVCEEMVVTDREVDEALHELTLKGGGLTRKLLGFAEPGEAEKC